MEQTVKKLSELKKEQILDILSKIMEKDESFKLKLQNSIDNQFTQLSRKNEIDADIDKYSELWDEAEEIIDKLNEYGGGPEEDEMTASDNLSEIVELFRKGNLNTDFKRKFVKGCIDLYAAGNSGMDDDLVHASFDVSENKEDWLFLIEQLKKIGSDYANDLIMRIYKDHLKNDEAYLEMRYNDLQYGMDYYDLVKYYDENGDKNKAFEIAEEGLKKGKGRIIDLIIYLRDYYKNKKDHYSTLKYYVLSFKESASIELYREIKHFCIGDEWSAVSKELYENTLNDESVKRNICLENKEYKKIFESITKTEYSFDDSWAKKIEPFFPIELLAIYKRKIKQNIEYKNVKNYYIASNYCFRVKHILVNILKKDKEWAIYLNSLKENYPKLPALQRELKNLEDNK